MVGLVLILSGILIKYFLLPKEAEPQEIANRIEKNLQTEISTSKSQLAVVRERIMNDDYLRFEDLNTIASDYPFYVYYRTRLFYWSEFQLVPEYNEFSDVGTIGFIHLDQGNFIVTRDQFNKKDDIYEIVSLIPVQTEYEIFNKYLESDYNDRIIEFPDMIISNSGNEGYPVKFDGQILFYVDSYISVNQYSIHFQLISISLYTIGLILILYTVYSKVLELTNRRKFEIALAILFISLAGVRFVMLFTEFPSAYANWVLFDSRLFASSILNPSIGDLMLNTLALFALILFAYMNYYRSNLFIKILGLKIIARWILSVKLILIGFLAMVYQFLIFRLIYENSQWSLDITSTLYFPASKVIFYLIFVINSAIFFLTFHLIFRIFTRVNDKSLYSLIINYSVGALIFILVAYNLNLPIVFIIMVNLGYFLVLHFLKLSRFLVQMRYLAFLYLFVAAQACALIGAYSVQYFEEENELENKFRFADQFLVESDNLGELLLSEAGFQIKQDPLITSRMYSSFMSKETISQKIKRVYLGSYFDKYNVQVNLYNATGQPFNSEGTQGTYRQIKDAFAQEQYETEFPNLYFVNRVGADVTKRYLYFIDIERYNQVIGYILIDLSLKKIIPESVYPELLVDSRFFQPYQESEYSYAVFIGGRATYSTGNYNYTVGFDNDLLENPSLFNRGLSYRGYHHFAVKDLDSRTIVITSTLYPAINVVSNFSFLFLILVAIIILIIVFYSIYNWLNDVKLKFATKIQLYINLAFIIPLFVVSIATLSLINKSFRKELEIEYYKKAENLGRNIIGDLNEYLKLDLDREDLGNRLASITANANLDANLYNIRGKLIGSSQPSIFDKKIISEYINPRVIELIREDGNSEAILRERIGSLTYNAAYVSLKSFNDGSVLGILNIPFFDSETIVERQQIDVLSNIMNIFTAIFLILLFLSYLASKWLTLPLQMITQWIRKISLSGENKPLAWNSEDEIGLLVGEYNRMLINLEVSKKALAKSEKESAWREMAQQVAHEIKNPLTPMKLTLQQLEKSLEELKLQKGSTEKPIKTLLYQIDNLSDIASSFSAFAKMPIPEMKNIELTSLLRSTFDLYKNQDKGKVTLNQYHRELYVLGDDQLMGRIFSNMIINSLQSSNDDDLVTVVGTIHVNGKGNVLITIKDDGNGIPMEIRDKIFVPNFSTKTNGSGIGLAIAKHGIENMGGKIWFESEIGIGTTFFIEIPLDSKGSFLVGLH